MRLSSSSRAIALIRSENSSSPTFLRYSSCTSGTRVLPSNMLTTRYVSVSITIVSGAIPLGSLRHTSSRPLSVSGNISNALSCGLSPHGPSAEFCAVYFRSMVCAFSVPLPFLRRCFLLPGRGFSLCALCVFAVRFLLRQVYLPGKPISKPRMPLYGSPLSVTSLPEKLNCHPPKRRIILRVGDAAGFPRPHNLPPIGLRLLIGPYGKRPYEEPPVSRWISRR